MQLPAEWNEWRTSVENFTGEKSATKEEDVFEEITWGVFTG